MVVGGTAGLGSQGYSVIITRLFGADQTCPPALEDALGNISSVESVATTLTPTVDGSLFYHYAGVGADRLSTMAATSPQVLLLKQQGPGGGRTYGVSADIVETAAETTATNELDGREQWIPGRPDRQPRATERSCAGYVVIMAATIHSRHASRIGRDRRPGSALRLAHCPEVRAILCL